MDDQIVICVLRSGGPDYGPQNVAALQRSLARHSKARLVCFSDVDVPCERIPLIHDWPGWWSKLEIFRFSYPRPVLYVDLDTTFVDDPAPLWRESFTMLERVGRPGDVGSGVMSFAGDYSYLYRAFDPSRHIKEYSTTAKWGDQSFIRDQLKVRPDRFPASLCASYKHHCTDYGKRPFSIPDPDTRVVYFHGKPRPWEVPECRKT
jgi:hypothetical protein